MNRQEKQDKHKARGVLDMMKWRIVIKITFPHLGNIYFTARAFLEELGHEVIPPPICSRKTLEIGSKYSPEDDVLTL